MDEIKTNHSITKIAYHIVICTKYRYQVLNPAIQIELKQLIVQICVNNNWKMLETEIVDDHVHMLIQTDHKVAPVEIVQKIKSITAIYIFQKYPNIKKNRYWGSGLWSNGAHYSTVGESNESIVKNYIKNQ